MKKYLYKLVLEDGNSFDYVIDGGIMFNAKNEAGEIQTTLITSAIFSEMVEVEDKPLVVEAEVVEQAPVIAEAEEKVAHKAPKHMRKPHKRSR